MRIIMMGTGPFAVPTFEVLLAHHQVLALVTRPVKAAGRQKSPANPMRDVAEARSLFVLDPENVNTTEAQAELAALSADLLVVCDYGQILANETLGVAPLGGINLHASLLPKYRGAAPINWAIYHGETETGVSVIHITPRLDAGPILVQRRTPIEPNETAVELEQRLAKLGVDAVEQAIHELSAWDGASPIGELQQRELVSRAPRLKKTDGEIDWTRTAQQIRNQVRAFKPWPGTYTHVRRGSGEPLRLILDQVEVVPGAAPAPAGTVVASDRELLVATGDDLLRIERIQPAGKRVMGADEFLRGYPLRPGERLGAANSV